VHDACTLVAVQMTERAFVPLSIWKGMPSGRQFLSAVKVCHGVCAEIIDRKRAERASSASQNVTPSVEGGPLYGEDRTWNFLDMLLDSMESDTESKHAMTNQDIADEVNTFIFEGQ